MDVYLRHFLGAGLRVRAFFSNASELVGYFEISNRSLDRRSQLEESVVLISSSVEGANDPLEIAKRLRAINLEAKLILLTNRAETEIELIHDAFDSVLYKPFTLSELVQTIESLPLHSKEVGEQEETLRYLESRSGVLVGLVNTTEFFLDSVQRAKTRLDVIAEANAASLYGVDEYRNAVEALNRKGIRPRIILEINARNLDVCRRLSLVSDLKHLSGIKGALCLTEDTCLFTVEPLERVELVSKLFYTRLETVVSHQQFLFETIWKATPSASERFEELGKEPQGQQRKNGIQKFPVTNP